MTFQKFRNIVAVLIAVALAATAVIAVAAEEKPVKRKAEEGLFAAAVTNYPDAEPVLGWIDSRQMYSLNGDWHIIPDPMDSGAPGGRRSYVDNAKNIDGMTLVEYDFDIADTVRVPGDFNTQHERYFFYQGLMWYNKKITKPELAAGEKLHLWFGGANFTAQVFMNGEAVGEHVGGYVPFSFDVTDAMVAGENDLMVRISNALDTESVPTFRTDWWPYGGLTRDVALVKTPAAYIQNAKVRLPKGSYETIAVDIETVGLAGEQVDVLIPELNVSATAQLDNDGKAVLKIAAKPELWSPANPKLYDVEIVAANDRLHDSIGFRHIETRGTKIYLNDEPIKFKGVSTHEEPIGEPGVAYSEAQIERLLTEAKELGVNFVRAAHYPYSRYMAKVADRMGIMLWEEVPVYWNISWENPQTLAIARDQMERLVKRDWNRASVVVWSVANETPYSEPRMAFLGTLIDDVRAMDDSRLVSAALLGGMNAFGKIAKHTAAIGAVDKDSSPETRAKFQAFLDKQTGEVPSATDPYHHIIDDPLGEITDIVAYNEYFGWYYSAFIKQSMGVTEGELRPIMFKHMANMTISSVFEKPIQISEFGAGAKAGNKGGKALLWTEEYQAQVYRSQTEMLNRSEQVQGMTPWILKDFRAMLRPLKGIQDHYNRKGLVDENGQRKQAFYVLQEFYKEGWQ